MALRFLFGMSGWTSWGSGPCFSGKGTVSETASGGTFSVISFLPMGRAAPQTNFPQELTASVHRQLATKLRPFSAHTLCPLLLSSLSSCSVKREQQGSGIPLMKHSIVMHQLHSVPYLRNLSATCTGNGGLLCLKAYTKWFCCCLQNGWLLVWYLTSLTFSFSFCEKENMLISQDCFES